MSDDETETFLERFWHLICTAIPALFYLLALMFILLLLTLITLFLGTPGTGYYAIAQVNFVLGVSVVAAVGYILFRCNRRDYL